jgi:hypothetical protein
MVFFTSQQGNLLVFFILSGHHGGKGVTEISRIISLARWLYHCQKDSYTSLLNVIGSSAQ